MQSAFTLSASVGLKVHLLGRGQKQNLKLLHTHFRRGANRGTNLCGLIVKSIMGAPWGHKPSVPHCTNTLTHHFLSNLQTNSNPRLPKHPQYPPRVFSETRATVRSSPRWEEPTPPGGPWPSPTHSSKGLQVILKNLWFWFFRPNLTEAKSGSLWFRWAGLPKSELQGNCIDILLLCMSSQTLHLALWEWGRGRGGGADNCQTKRHHRLLLNVSTCKGELGSHNQQIGGIDWPGSRTEPALKPQDALSQFNCTVVALMAEKKKKKHSTWSESGKKQTNIT